MEKLKYCFDKVLEWSCIFLMSIMTLLVTYQVIVRYCFNRPSAISEVLSKYLFIWMIMFCSAYVFGLREHMNIPFVKDKLSPKLKMLCELASEIIIFLFAIGVMVIGGYLGAIRQINQLDSALQLSMGIIYIAIPISGVCIVFYFVYNFLNILKRNR